MSAELRPVMTPFFTTYAAIAPVGLPEFADTLAVKFRLVPCCTVVAIAVPETVVGWKDTVDQFVTMAFTPIDPQPVARSKPGPAEYPFSFPPEQPDPPVQATALLPLVMSW